MPKGLQTEWGRWRAQRRDLGRLPREGPLRPYSEEQREAGMGSRAGRSLSAAGLRGARRGSLAH